MRNLTGERFGRLLVEEFSHTRLISDKPRHFWKCKCDCGNETIVIGNDLTRRQRPISSCGAACPLKFMEKFNSVNADNDIILKSNYEGWRNKILVGTKYGDCLVRSHQLIEKKYKPCITAAVNKTEYFINLANEIHGNKYDYSKSIYKDMVTPVVIICKEHREFSQVAALHLNRSRYASGCPDCGRLRKGNRTSGSNRLGGIKKINS